MPRETLNKKKEYFAKYRLEHKRQIKKRNAEYYIKHKEQIREYYKQYYLLHRDEKKEYYLKNIDKIKEYRSKNYDKNKIALYNKIYYENNKSRIIKTQNESIKKKRKVNSLFRIAHNLRTRISKIFIMKNIYKKNKMIKFLGTDFKTMKQHIESNFQEGMSWDNYGRETWHIDHIIPFASAKTEEGLIRLCHYKNLQPLWAKDNLSKGSKLNQKLCV